MFKRTGTGPKFQPNIDVTNPRCMVIRNMAYAKGPEIARIYRVDEGAGLPHYVMLEPGYEKDSGVRISYRVPGKEPAILGDREPLLVNASTRFSLQAGELNLANARIVRSDPGIFIRMAHSAAAPEYEAQLDYRSLEEIKKGGYPLHQFWIDRNSFQGGHVGLWTEYKPDAFKAFSLFMVSEGEFMLVNDGNLHVIVATGDDTIRSVNEKGQDVEDISCEYMNRGIIAAYPDYSVYLGLSPVQPEIGFKLESMQE